jgi:hypothetical protein
VRASLTVLFCSFVPPNLSLNPDAPSTVLRAVLGAPVTLVR